MNDRKPEIEAMLADFWDKNVIEPTPKEERGVDEPLSLLDSPTAVDVLLELEEKIGQRLSIEATIKKGGYATKNEFVTELTAAVVKQLEKSHERA